MRQIRRLIAMLIALALLPAGADAQARGTISGRVVDQGSGQPLVGASVTVVGTTLGAQTNQQGEYRIEGVPAGPRQVSASTLGYTPATQQVTVAAGGTSSANFDLNATALELGGLVVTATGREQREREIGAAVGNIEVEEMDLAPVTSMADLIQGRVAGAVVMQSSGTTGAGARVRIRGNNSISLNNAPLLIIDGVRVDNTENDIEFGVGGQEPSRLNDLNPEDIESIEILKGPAASALYGTAAANGVIQVTTRRGRAGAPQFRVWSEYGTFEEVTDFPENVFARGTLVAGEGVTNVPAGTVGRCDVIRQAIGANPGPGQIGCTAVTETFRYNPLENPASSPFREGDRRTLGGSVSGGGEGATFYVSGEYEDEIGVLQLSDQRRVRFQGNVTGNVGPDLTVSTKIGYVESDLQLPQNDNALYGVLGLGLYGVPTPANVEAQQGYLADPQFFRDWLTFQDMSRFIGSVNADYRPLSWLNVNGVVGLDRTTREDLNRLPRENAYAIYGPPYAGGFIQNSGYDIYNLTSNLSGTAIFDLAEDVVSTTAVGTQYIREQLHNVYAFGSELTPGLETTLAGANAFFDADEDNLRNATLSAYVQQQLGWRDRVFLTAAVRGDQNTAFGTDIGWIWYPALSASWVVSEEPFFPQYGWLSDLRLRAAWGQSGLRPGATDALQSFTSNVAVFQDADLPAIVINEIGNPDLRPERSTEWEVGLEGGLLDDRLGVELTYFDKQSSDALVSKPLPPSLGASLTRYENLGRVDNSGFEMLLSAQPVRQPNFEWNISLSGSTVSNELVDLGEDAQGEPIPDIVFGLNGDTQRHSEGFPLGSWFHSPIVGFADEDGDGLLSADEVEVNTDTTVFLGNPFPTRELSLSSDIRLFQWARLSALLDYKGGFELMNFTRAFRCEGPNYVCNEAYDPATPLEDQAALVAWNSYGSLAGYVEDADFWKLRELALSFNVPSSIARRVGSNGLTLTVAGRNLATWTDYRGFDPEVNFAGQSNFSSGDAATLPANRHFMIRVDANF